MRIELLGKMAQYESGPNMLTIVPISGGNLNEETQHLVIAKSKYEYLGIQNGKTRRVSNLSALVAGFCRQGACGGGRERRRAGNDWQRTGVVPRALFQRGPHCADDRSP